MCRESYSDYSKHLMMFAFDVIIFCAKYCAFVDNFVMKHIVYTYAKRKYVQERKYVVVSRWQIVSVCLLREITLSVAIGLSLGEFVFWSSEKLVMLQELVAQGLLNSEYRSLGLR